MTENKNKRDKSILENYCADAAGDLMAASLGWRDTLQPVCIVDYSVRERNIYQDLWGIAFRYEPGCDRISLDKIDGSCDSDLCIEIVGSTLDKMSSLPKSALQKENSCLGRFYQHSNAILIPAHLAWRPNPPHLVCLLDHASKEYHSYENVWEIIFQSTPTTDDRPRESFFADGNEPKSYIYLEASDVV